MSLDWAISFSSSKTRRNFSVCFITGIGSKVLAIAAHSSGSCSEDYALSSSKFSQGTWNSRRPLCPQDSAGWGTLPFRPFLRNAKTGSDVLLDFLLFSLYDDHESSFLPLKLCLQDIISVSPLCHCQFTMCLTIQSHYYKPCSYKNSRNSFVTFLLTRDSHSVTHWCHRSRCSSHGVTAVLNKGTTHTQRCCRSSQGSDLSWMAYLQSSTWGAWTAS